MHHSPARDGFGRRHDRRASLLVRTRAIAFALAAIFAHGHAAAGDAGLDVLAKKLKEPDENTRRQAVVDLAALKSAPSWDLVAGALADASPLVADEAQWMLGANADPLALAALCGKNGLGAKDAPVRERAAEALGRKEQEVDGNVLAKVLADRVPEVRRSALHAIERLGQADHLTDASRAALVKRIEALPKTEKLEDVRAVAMWARYCVEHCDLGRLRTMQTSDDMSVAWTSVAQLVNENDFQSLVTLYDKSIDKQDFATARAVADGFIAHPSDSSAKSLVAIFKRHYCLRLKWMIVDTLRDWSGLQTGLDEEAWGAWGDKLPSGWSPKTGNATDAVHTYGTKATVFGSPVLSQRVGILVDTTGWAAEKDAGGTTAKAKLKKELATMFKNLDPDATFKLIPYSNAPTKCGPEYPVENRIETVNPALQCLSEATGKGQDNFLEAARYALGQPGSVDSILVVTDSVPRGENHVRPEIVLEEWNQANRFHGAFLDVLLVHGDAEKEAQWKKMCVAKGGNVTKVDL